MFSLFSLKIRLQSYKEIFSPLLKSRNLFRVIAPVRSLKVRGCHDLFIKNHEVLTTEREPEGPAQRSN